MSKIPSFQFYPGDWKGTYWITIDDPWSFCAFESKPGVYVVYADNQLIYVGQSSNIRKRIHGHDINLTLSGSYRTPWGYFRNLRIKVKYGRRFGDWCMIEARLIYRLQPKHNCVGGTKTRSKKGELL